MVNRNRNKKLKELRDIDKSTPIKLNAIGIMLKEIRKNGRLSGYEASSMRNNLVFTVNNAAVFHDIKTTEKSYK